MKNDSLLALCAVGITIAIAACSGDELTAPGGAGGTGGDEQSDSAVDQSIVGQGGAYVCPSKPSGNGGSDSCPTSVSLSGTGFSQYDGDTVVMVIQAGVAAETTIQSGSFDLGVYGCYVSGSLFFFIDTASNGHCDEGADPVWTVQYFPHTPLHVTPTSGCTPASCAALANKGFDLTIQAAQWQATDKCSIAVAKLVRDSDAKVLSTWWLGRWDDAVNIFNQGILTPGEAHHIDVGIDLDHQYGCDPKADALYRISIPTVSSAVTVQLPGTPVSDASPCQSLGDFGGP